MPGPDVIYTQPANFSRKRFLLQLGTMVIVVLALLFAMSLFFKVEKISVSGVSKYTEWDIREASGIQEGDNLFTLSKARICTSIYERLPYVKIVRIGRKLPDTVLIEIEELPVTYGIQAENGKWWFIRSDGVLLEQAGDTLADGSARILGVRITEPVVNEKATALETASTATMPGGEAVPDTVKSEEQLIAALTIIENLESNGILGEVASIDVSNLWDLELWYGDRIRVVLGDSTLLKEKITTMTTAIREEVEPYAKGTLDVSKEDGKTHEGIFKRQE
jgi:hypothetical protein